MDLDWTRGFTLDFSLSDGHSTNAAPTVRRLSQMWGMFADAQATERAIADGDPVVYAFYELGAPAHPGDLAFGTSITYPGRIGREYYMTKGHYHAILDTAEVYYTLSGEGAMLTEGPDGDVRLHRLTRGTALYVPKCHAHRTVNTGAVPLVTFFTLRADAGHDYGTIEAGGFRKLVVEGPDGKPALEDNPRTILTSDNADIDSATHGIDTTMPHCGIVANANAREYRYTKNGLPLRLMGLTSTKRGPLSRRIWSALCRRHS